MLRVSIAIVTIVVERIVATIGAWREVHLLLSVGWRKIEFVMLIFLVWRVGVVTSVTVLSIPMVNVTGASISYPISLLLIFHLHLLLLALLGLQVPHVEIQGGHNIERYRGWDWMIVSHVTVRQPLIGPQLVRRGELVTAGGHRRWWWDGLPLVRGGQVSLEVRGTFEHLATVTGKWSLVRVNLFMSDQGILGFEGLITFCTLKLPVI